MAPILKFSKCLILSSIVFIFQTLSVMAADSVNDADNALLFMENKINTAFMASGGVEISSIDFTITSEVYDTQNIDSLDLVVAFQYTVDGDLYTGTGTWNSTESPLNGETVSTIDFSVQLIFGSLEMNLEYSCNGILDTGNQTESISYSHNGLIFHDDITTTTVDVLNENSTTTTTTANHLITENGNNRSETTVIEEETFSNYYSKITSSYEILAGGNTTVVEVKGERHRPSENEVRMSISKYDISKNGVKTHTLATGITEARMSLTDVVETETLIQTVTQINESISLDELIPFPAEEWLSSETINSKVTQTKERILLEEQILLSTKELSEYLSIEATNQTVLATAPYDSNSDNPKRLHYTLALSLKSLVPEEQDIKHAVTASIDLTSLVSASGTMMILLNGDSNGFWDGFWTSESFPLTDAMMAGTLGAAVGGALTAMQNPGAWSNLPLNMAAGALVGATLYTYHEYVKYKQNQAFKNRLINRAINGDNSRTHSGMGMSLGPHKKILLTLIILILSMRYVVRQNISSQGLKNHSCLVG